MRLLSTSTYTLTYFQGSIPPYAILSHVWQREEVTFQDIANLKKAKLLKGWYKIVGACDTAKKAGFEYIWIDTCCINKESSAELSEAVNSMYAWYQNARICYAYLWDVPSYGDHENPHSLFAMSVWFTRGWTLQELIAPSRVIFYGCDWVDLGTKATLQDVISTVTGIDTQIIVGGSALKDVPIAVRMSWAACRNTTREEDTAYSLMGIFDVNMPLLYGEGKKAFIRLQHEIIKTSNDHSIFVWSLEPEFDDLLKEALVLLTSDTRRGILARSPREFLHSHNVERIPQVPLSDSRSRGPSKKTPTPYSITNQGLHIELPIAMNSKTDHTLSAFLNCRFAGETDSVRIILGWSDDLQRYVRLGDIQSPGENPGRPDQVSSLYIADNYQAGSHVDTDPTFLKIKTNVSPDYGKPMIWCTGFEPLHTGQPSPSKSFFTSELGDADLLVFNHPDKREHFGVIFGVWKPGVVWCDVLTNIKPVSQSHEEILAAYAAAARAKARSAGKFLDRASAELTDGWLLAVSLASSAQFRFFGEVEIKRAPKKQPQGPVPFPIQPPDMKACLVVPLIHQHGFMVDVNNLRQNTPDAKWVQHRDSFILYGRHEGLDGKEVLQLPFKSSTSEERFYLLLKVFRGTLRTSIEKNASGLSQHMPLRKYYGGRSYEADIGQGKTAFVTQRTCVAQSPADWIIYVSM